MGSQERREKEREEVRAKILDAARELFVTHGYEAVTMRKIAAKIDYTATALYTHFADKEALLLALCDADFLALRHAFDRIARIADPIERLRALGRAYVAFALEYPNHYMLMFMTRHPEKAAERSKVQQGNPDQDAYAFLRETIAEGLEAGRFREELDDADLLAQVVWSGVHGVVSLHLVKGDDPWLDWRPVEATAGVVIDVTIRGLLRGRGWGDGGPGVEDPAA
ncbi:MAG: TetR/AcrR family transcriptional regulator [Planctomycetaceae bacterium]|nr:TetR/AcrR family transcriptional regulator [Planctomycetaceae bacterium]